MTKRQYKYDDHSSIPFKLVVLKAPGEDELPEVPHRHNFYQLFFFTSGGGRHLIDFNSFPILANEVHYVAPGAVHCLQRTAETRGYVILFSREFPDKLPAQIAGQEIFLSRQQYLKPVAIPRQNDSQLILDILRSMERESLIKTAEYLQVIRHYLHILLIKLQTSFNEALSPGDEKDHENHNIAHRFRHLVDLHFDEWHQVAQYITELAITPDQLNELTKRAWEKTAGSIIKERIFLEAKRLLFHSDLSVKEIAWQTGFEDPAYFTRFFRKRAGASPQQFREQVRKKYKT